MTNLRLLRNAVLVKVDQPQEQTSSGIFIKEQWKTLPPFAEVLKVGPAVTVVKPGDRVLIMRFAAIDTPDEDIKIIHENYIEGVFEDAGETSQEHEGAPEHAVVSADVSE